MFVLRSVCVRFLSFLESIGREMDELERKRQEAQFQARMQKVCPDGPPFKGRWYIGEEGKRFWLNWWNVPTIDL